MKLEEIEAEWEIDAKIDKTQLSNEALKISSLQGKYYKWYVREILQLKGLDEAINILKLEKWEFYTQGPTKETEARGWKFPGAVILKAEVDRYMQADPDIIKANLNAAKQKEKVNFLKHIIDSLNGRSWNIRAAIDFEKFRAGG